MTTEVVTFEEVLERAKKLPLPDQARLIEQLATTLSMSWPQRSQPPPRNQGNRFGEPSPIWGRLRLPKILTRCGVKRGPASHPRISDDPRCR
jgi:hypothetical protein